MRLTGLNDIGIEIATNRNDYVAIGIYVNRYESFYFLLN